MSATKPLPAGPRGHGDRPVDCRRGKKAGFAVEAHNGVDLISRGRHERFVIDKERFDANVGAKRANI